MSEHVTAALNGFATLAVRIELRRGGQPSTCEVALPPGAKPAPGEALSLELRDTHTRRQFNQFVCTSVEATADGRAIIHGADLRREWALPLVSLPASTGGNATDLLANIFRAAGLANGNAPPAVGQLPPLPRLRGSAAVLAEQICALVGATIGVSDEGNPFVVPPDASPDLDAALIDSRHDVELPAEIIVLGSSPLQLRTVTDWQPVLPEADQLRPLAESLAAWGISESQARQACLDEGGFSRLIGTTAPDTATRLALLRRYAFRLLQASPGEPWVPVGGVAPDGTLLPPTLETRATRATARAPQHPREQTFESPAIAPATESYEIDLQRRALLLDEPPYRHEAQIDTDPTRQSRHLQGGPLVALTIAVEAQGDAFRHTQPGVGAGPAVVINAPQLVPVMDESGSVLNAAILMQQARQLADALAANGPRRVSRLAGIADVAAVGTVERAVIEAGTRGLTTTVTESPITPPVLEPHASAPDTAGQALRPSSPDHQPINAWRAGPLVLATADGVNQAESVLAMRAAAQDADTGAIVLDQPGGLALPYFLASEDAGRFGRWFFVAGAEALGDGRIRVLASDDRHAPVDAPALNARRRQTPAGVRGLLVSTGGAPEFLDAGPLVSDSRGRKRGEVSDLVSDVDVSTLSKCKRGGLQFLTVLALSPAHQRAGVGGGAPGWVPALNFRDGQTGNHAAFGRGLFAEGSGNSLGRLAAHGNGGPLLADAEHCGKHLYGAAADDDGLYREAAGHISTEAFFKLPGDEQHDAPLRFYALPFAGRVPPWRPYEAQIRYDADDTHTWDGKQRAGRWKIQYRVPFLPGVPPTWNPPIKPPDEPPPEDPPPPWVPVPIRPPEDIVPVVSENEIWAPSHDWVPAPSENDDEEVPFPGPSIKSQGWAGESEGYPDPSLGGGCVFLPPDRSLADSGDDGDRETFVLLHPEVSLAFGHPGFAQGRPVNGWDVQLSAPGGDLLFTPTDEEGNADEAPRAVQINADAVVTGKLTVEGLIDPTGLQLDPQSSNPGTSPTLWADNDSLPRWGSAALMLLGSELRTRVVAYTGSGATGKTVTLAGINRAHALVLMGRENSRGVAIALPAGGTGAVNFKRAATGGNETAFTLDAPPSGEQTLTINSTHDDFNADGESYDLLVIGTPT